MTIYDSPAQKKMQIEGMRENLKWFINHKRCRLTRYEKGKVITHNRLYHIEGFWDGVRYLIGYYLKCLARKIQGEKLTFHGRYK